MKKLTTTVLAVFTAIALFAQTPQAFKFQAVARDNAGEIIANQEVSFQISILMGSAGGTSVYTEIHNETTNDFGLVNLEIGNGTVVSGDFTTINWGEVAYFLQVEMDEAGGTDFEIMGTSQLLHVPYASNAKSLTLTSPDGTHFEVTVEDNGNLNIKKICPPMIADVDGNNYSTVKIGDQCWMKENLKTTKFRNEVIIPNVSDASTWETLESGAYVWYDNDLSWKHLYGALYNWYATIDPNGLCPEGWHVPTASEWTTLSNFIGGTGSPHGNELKSCRQVNSPLGGECNTTDHPRWNENGYEHGTDDYGFSGLPGGNRYSFGIFSYIGVLGIWWSSTENSSTYAYDRILDYGNGFIGISQSSKQTGYSVRCLQD
jgi:uncharacterized protein (TIGR02145 family)